EHRTTLIFVNTRRLAERVARHLGERIGDENVTAHHGSLARLQRLAAEQRLKAGELRALVATASLELGIDIGTVDLVCQLGSTRSISTLLQRVGRSGHTLAGFPKGRLFPLTRDELVECAALLDSIRRGELDCLAIPQQPLDILAQQIVAAVACEEWTEDELYALVRRAYPYGQLARSDFDAVLQMLAAGYTTRWGRRGAYLHHDTVNRRLRGRRGARLAAITSGGAIPDTADYEVILEPTGTFIGTVNEDFAIESLAGDIFQLGNTSWRIRRVEPGRVRVEDAKGQPPSIPFWLGEAPARTTELSAAVSRLRMEVARRLTENPLADGRGTDLDAALSWMVKDVGVAPAAAGQIVEYLAAAQVALGVMPSQQTLVIERFFDESGGMQLVIHSPFGSRLNRAWGLALRKRFCRKFNFELQAAATEDAIVLSLGQSHSFPLEDVFNYLRSNSVRELLIQAVLDAPMFNVRWRWNATRALAVLRWRSGKKVPPQLQRVNAEDLLAAIFPDQLACAENLSGEREIPEHPLVNQTLRDCLEEAMDLTSFEALLTSMERGEKQLVARNLNEPSPLAAEILTARPYAFLDDAPLEERRTQAVHSRRWLTPENASDLGHLDIAAIQRVRGEAWPQVENADELHEALVQLGFLTEVEGQRGETSTASSPESGNDETLLKAAEYGDSHPLTRPTATLSPTGREEQGAEKIRHSIPQRAVGLGEREKVSWEPWFKQLMAENRATRLEASNQGPAFWVAAERLPQLKAVFPSAAVSPPIASAPISGNKASLSGAAEEALVDVLRGRLEGIGPATATTLAVSLGVSLNAVEVALARLEAEGFILRGRFTPGAGETEWCVRHLLARIHRYTLDRLRREIEPVASADFIRFLLDWQKVTPSQRSEGPESLAAVLEQLEGFEAPAAAWEGEILPARVAGYDPVWLDAHCLSGRWIWARLTLPKQTPQKGSGSGPIRSTPIALLNRENFSLWDKFVPHSTACLSLAAQALYDHLGRSGALFFEDLVKATGLLRTQAENGLGELVTWGLVTADSFTGLRALLTSSSKRPPVSIGRRKQSVAVFGMENAGRWSRLSRELKEEASGTSRQGYDHRHARDLGVAETLCRTLLRRYGVVFRRLLEREGMPRPWRELLKSFWRMEARGEIRGGRFVAGFSGEQFALPEAVGLLRSIRRSPTAGHLVSVSAADPLNLMGILTPGSRVPPVSANRILYRDGVPIAIREAGQVRFLTEMDSSSEWQVRNALLRRTVPPQLRAYLGQPA
ncbi:MAG: ATP-dependent DNA helicase, partial [Acidobacteria bacterium]